MPSPRELHTWSGESVDLQPDLMVQNVTVNKNNEHRESVLNLGQEVCGLSSDLDSGAGGNAGRFLRELFWFRTGRKSCSLKWFLGWLLNGNCRH